MDFSLLNWKKNEVVFVALVLTCIFGISLFQLRISQMKTRDAQRKADVSLVKRALDRYFDDYLVYPPASDDGKIIACGRVGSMPCEWDSGPMVDLDEVEYLDKLPIEPFAHKGYRYVYETDDARQTYKIYTTLEYKSDPEYRNNLTARCGENVECRWYVEN